MDDQRIISPEKRHGEGDDIERSLRPPSLAEFTGQEDLKESLSIAIEAAKHRGDALDHCLFSGPPGLGKTTLAGIIAKEMGVNIHITSGPVLEKASDLAGLLTSLQENDILFIDEIHRLNRVVEEYLYPAMEDFRLDIMLDSGPAARSVNLPLKHFTLVGVEISEEAARLLGGRCRGTPRVANRVLRRCRDVAQVRGTGAIDVNSTAKTLEMLGIDGEGLDPTDRKILAMMIDKFDGGPVGLGTISAALGEEPDTLEEVYEPYLIRKGLLARTPRGRTATQSAYRMFHKEPPQKVTGTPSDQIELF